MLRAIGVVAVLAAACGRLDFDALTGPCARATTVPDPIAISGLTIQVSDFAGDFTPLPQTTVTVTASGRGAFARHVATLQEIIAAAGRDN